MGFIVHYDNHGTAERSRYGYHTTDYPKLDQVQNLMSAISAWIAGISILALAVVTLAEVFFREFFSHPLGWNISLTEKYLLPLIAFFGFITAYRTGSHIAVETVFSKLPLRLQKLVLLAIHVIALISLAFLFIGGLNETLLAYSLSQRVLPGMADLPFYDWTYRIIVPVSAFMCALIVAIDIYREIASPWHRPFTDYDPGEEN